MMLITNKKVLALIAQLMVLTFIIAFLVWGVNNAAVNLEKAGIATGFGFLSETAGFDIAQTLIPYDRNSSYFDAFIVGLLNTLLVASLAIIISTFFGFFLGICRLSPNFLLRNLASVFIGSVRNFPLLLQILFWYIAVLSPLPGPKKAFEIINGFYLSNRGLVMPKPIWTQTTQSWFIAIALAVICAIVFIYWAKKHHRKTGQYIPAYLLSFFFVGMCAVVFYFIFYPPVEFSIPLLKGFNFRGGVTILPEFIALLIALSCYSSAFIAENVRAGILSVNSGQKEAAKALSLPESKIMRLIIIPQAMRVIIPPLTSQHLTTVKNSSLAVVIGYPDLIHVFAGTTLNQSGQVVEIIVITIAVYLTISLMISAAMNFYNKHILLKER